ncbi:MAG: hypothetical protein ABSB11_04895 [Sedimentisphaerales bacterium]|jgi:hypothetical protein
MLHNLTRRLGKIEQKVGGDTIVIRTLADFLVYTDNVKRGIKVGKVIVEPKLAEIIGRAARANRESKDNEQKH